jgi:hypothetical protein
LNRWLPAIAGLLVGGVVGILARGMVRVVYDSAANTDRFDEGLFVIGTLVVTVAFLVAAAVSTPTALGAAVASTGSLVLSWTGLRLIDAQPAAGGGFGYMADELRWALSTGYADIGAVVLSGGFVAIAIERARRGRAMRPGSDIGAVRRLPNRRSNRYNGHPWRWPDGRGRDRRKAASEESPSSVEQARG